MRRPHSKRLRLGIPRLRCRFWRLDDLVWIVSRGGAREHVSGSEIRDEMAETRLVYTDSVRVRILRHACSLQLASGYLASKGRHTRDQREMQRRRALTSIMPLPAPND